MIDTTTNARQKRFKHPAALLTYPGVKTLKRNLTSFSKMEEQHQCQCNAFNGSDVPYCCGARKYMNNYVSIVRRTWRRGNAMNAATFHMLPQQRTGSVYQKPHQRTRRKEFNILPAQKNSAGEDKHTVFKIDVMRPTPPILKDVDQVICTQKPHCLAGFLGQSKLGTLPDRRIFCLSAVDTRILRSNKHTECLSPNSSITNQPPRVVLIAATFFFIQAPMAFSCRRAEQTS